MKTVKMIFSADQSLNFNPKHFLKGVEYDVPEKDVTRWLKRGGQIVSEIVGSAKPVAPPKAIVVEEETEKVDLEELCKGISDESDGSDDEGYF